MPKRFTAIKLDKVRNFRLGPKATSEFKTVSGKSIDQIGKDGFDIMEIAQLLYSGCMHEDPDLTPEKMMDILDDFELDELAGLISNVFPQSEGEPVPNV